MKDSLVCYRCGASLDGLSLPLGRSDGCPSCSADLHVCRMCVDFDATVARQCREDSAEDVYDKEKANFCEWFRPAAGVFDRRHAAAQVQAKAALDALFGEGDGGTKSGDTGAAAGAEDLFK